MLHRKHLALIPLFGLAMACGDSKESDDDAAGDEEADVGPASGALCPDTDPPTYESFGKEFMESYCTTCHASSVTGSARHDAPTDHNFDKLQGIQSAIDHIDQTAAAGPSATNTLMPPPGYKAPTTDERKKLGQWLACGAD